MNAPTAEGPGLAERLRDLWAVIRMNAHIVAAFTVTVVVVGGIVTALTPRVYKATALVHLVPFVGQEVQVQRIVDIDMRGGYQEVERFYRTQLEIIKTRSFARDVLVEYRAAGFDDLDPYEDSARFVRMITVFPRERSQIIEIAVQHGEPQNAAVLANLVARVYVAQNLSARQDTASEARGWLDEKSAEFEVKVADAYSKMLTFQEENDLVDVDDGSTALRERKSELDSRYGEVATEKVLLSSRVRSFERLLDEGSYDALAAAIANPVMASLAQSYSESAAEVSRLSAKYGPKHPEMQQAVAEQKRLEERMRAAVREALGGDRARLALLEAQEIELIAEIEKAKTEILEVERLHAQYAALKRDLDQTTAFYTTLSERADELDLSSRTQLNNARVVDEAVEPKRPIKPRVAMNLFLALIAGLAGGAGLAIARSWLDETITRPIDVQTYLKVPFLGLVPHVPDASDRPADDLFTWRNPDSLVSEALRSLRTLLDLGTSSKQHRRLLITSSVAAEGKTGTSVRVGVSYAQQGKTVCLVDCDHRRARLHKVFDGEKGVGLLGVLGGQATLEEALRPTEVPNLTILPLGERHPEASRLLGSEQMRQLLEELGERFDRVIIDTPPAAALSEAVTLSRMVDAVILVVRSGKVSRNVVRHTLDRFRHVGAEIAGVILNDVVVDRRTSAGSYYYYDYYGYAPYVGDGARPESGEDRDAANA